MVTKLLVTSLLAFVAGLLAPAAAYKDPHCGANRHVVVHLFEWRWNDIASECERFLGPMGYCGVQVSPPNEHRIVTNPFRPWWERYQPVSYILVSRSGNEQEFINMVNKCNSNGVRIYVDAVINHMAGVGVSGRGSAGSYFDSGKQDFPGVPFSDWDFNGRGQCSTGSLNIENYNDPVQVRNCRLVGLADLQTGKDYVQRSIAGYLNKLVDIGVAGFRIDAAKHMWPDHIRGILGRVNNLNSRIFGSNKRPFVFQEVIDLGGEPIKNSEYTPIARVTEFNYGAHLSRAFQKNYPLKNLHNFGEAWGLINGNDAIGFIDNHDNQRGHGGGGAILTFRQSKLYKAATAFALAHPYGFLKIMSSYNWIQRIENGKDKNDWIGPPANSDGSTKPVTINADLTCGNGWICEHRWRQIYSMVKFRNLAFGSGLTNWWDNGSYQIAFSRGNRGFIAITLQGDLRTNIRSGMADGSYCDIISGSKTNGRCTGKTVTVSGGNVNVQLGQSEDDAVLAIHAESKL